MEGKKKARTSWAEEVGDEIEEEQNLPEGILGRIALLNFVLEDDE